MRLLPLLLLATACTLQDTRPAAPADAADKMSTEFLGLRTAAYSVPDLEAAKAWYSQVLGLKPYFDEPYYVGFNVHGFELGLTPDSAAAPQRAAAGVAYWGVADAGASVERLVGLGAVVVEPLQDVGDGIRTATLRDPFGNLFGVIENPVFRATDPRSPGPGR